MDDFNKKILMLYFEDFLLVVFICLNILNMIGDKYERDFLRSNCNIYKVYANRIFDFTLFVTIIIYFYFLIRNYKSYNDVSYDKKDLYSVKLFGCIFVIVGIICLFYFQRKQSNFVGVPII